MAPEVGLDGDRRHVLAAESLLTQQTKLIVRAAPFLERGALGRLRELRVVDLHLLAPARGDGDGPARGLRERAAHRAEPPPGPSHRARAPAGAPRRAGLRFGLVVGPHAADAGGAAPLGLVRLGGGSVARAQRADAGNAARRGHVSWWWVVRSLLLGLRRPGGGLNGMVIA